MSDYMHTKETKRIMKRSISKLTHKQLVDRMMKLLDVLNDTHTCVHIADTHGLDNQRGEWEWLLDTVESFLRGYDLPKHIEDELINERREVLTKLREGHHRARVSSY